MTTMPTPGRRRDRRAARGHPRHRVRARRPRLRRRPHDLERDVRRRPPGARRALRGHGRRHPRHRAGAQRGPRDRRARRLALDPRLLDHRGRIVIDLLDDEGRPRRSRHAPRGRPARPAVAGPRRRDAGLRARRDRRPGLDHRRLGLHPRRRHRLARAQAGPGLRPPRERRRRHRRRPPRARRRRRRSRAALGAARWRRQLRRRHRAGARRSSRSGRWSTAGSWSSPASARPTSAPSTPTGPPAACPTS